jgi:hypothetical protein
VSYWIKSGEGEVKLSFGCSPDGITWTCGLKCGALPQINFCRFQFTDRAIGNKLQWSDFDRRWSRSFRRWESERIDRHSLKIDDPHSLDILRTFRALILGRSWRWILDCLNSKITELWNLKPGIGTEKGGKGDSFDRGSLLRFSTLESKTKNLKIFCYRYGPQIP